MSDNDQSVPVPMQGWQCPSCGSVYSPFTSRCEHCGPRTYTTTMPSQCPYCYLPLHMCRGHNICWAAQ